MSDPVILILLCGVYVLGSVPFGLVIARLFGLGDLRTIGSGNIGTTNVLRTGNRLAAGMTLILDSGKGAVAVIIVSLITPRPEAIALAAVVSVIGHCYPIWLRFRGGKGVATGIGVVLAMHPASGLVMCGVWLVAALAGRISSLAALAAYGIAPISLAIMFTPPQQTPYALAGAGIAALSFWRHRGNIKRLLAGEEPRIGL